MSDNHDILIIRQLDGTASAEEKKRLLYWLQESTQNSTYFSEIQELWDSCKSTLKTDLETETALNKLRSRILHQPQQKVYTVKRIAYATLHVAAVLALLVTVRFAYITYNKSTVPDTVIINRLLTGDGSKGRFILPDSTVVWLNANTTLEYPEQFSENERKVSLNGEAYFEVNRNDKSPFRVQADGMHVEVLGTRFVVQNYKKKEALEAILVSGKVKVKGSYFKKELILQPNQLISYSKQTSETKLKNVDTSDYISWINNKIIFDNDKLANIIINLEKWYGVDIQCTESLAQSTYMSFTIRSESLDEILKAMSLIAPIHYNWKNDRLYLSVKNRENK